MNFVWEFLPNEAKCLVFVNGHDHSYVPIRHHVARMSDCTGDGQFEEAGV